MKIGIIGAGAVGATLAELLVKLGHQVRITNSRGPQSLIALANDIGAQAVSIHEVTLDAELVVIAIPTKAIITLNKSIFMALPEHVPVIDTCNYHPQLRDGIIEAIEQGMVESQWVAQQIGRPVIKAFNTLLATTLAQNGASASAQHRIALAVAGDSVKAKNLVFNLVNQLGFDPVDGGSLDDSWRQQTGAPAYCNDLSSPALIQVLAQADRGLIAHYRIEREQFLKQSMRI